MVDLLLTNTMQAADEVRYLKSVAADRVSQLDEQRNRIEENMLVDSNQKKTLEDQIQSNLNSILASDESRRYLFQLSLDEDQQIAMVILLVHLWLVCLC